MILVELCAGTASVSLWAMARCSPLTGYMGSKRRWASALVQALEVDRPDRVVLVDAGPWGDVWSVLQSHEQRWRVAAQLDAWVGQDLPALWARLVVEPPPDAQPAWRVAQFLWLQARAAGTIPVWWSHETQRWESPTGSRTEAAHARRGSAYTAGGRGCRGVQTPATIASRVRALDVLPWDRIEVVHGDARYVEPVRGATVYLDPPYVGCPRYAALFPRAHVVEHACRWVDAGARVAISEATPLDLPGWTSRRLAPREYVTASWPIVLPEQGELFVDAARG